MKVILNIGMGNNPFHWLNISRRFAYHTYGVQVEHTQLVNGGIWQGIEEDTLVVHLKEVEMSIQQLQSFVELLVMSFNQECIAVKAITTNETVIEYSALVYNPYFRDSKRRI